MQKYPIPFSCIVIHILKLNRCIRNDGRWLKKRQEVSNKDQTRETGSGENDIVQDVMKMLKSEERSESWVKKKLEEWNNVKLLFDVAIFTLRLRSFLPLGISTHDVGITTDGTNCF